MPLRTPMGAGGSDGEHDDRPRFEELWALYDTLRNYCRRIAGDAAPADDVVQDAYVEVLVRLDRLDRLERRSSFMPWLATVARCLMMNEFRRYRHAVPVEVVPERPGGSARDPAETAVTRDEVRCVRAAAFDLLTPRERELLTRRVDRGMSIEELAPEERTSPGAVRSVLSRAHAKLRARVEEGAAGDARTRCRRTGAGTPAPLP